MWYPSHRICHQGLPALRRGRPGIKGWLQLEIPALYMKYKTVMAYKAAAKRMRQVLDIRDPLPLSAALPQEGGTQDHGADEICVGAEAKVDRVMETCGVRAAEGDERRERG